MDHINKIYGISEVKPWSRIVNNDFTSLRKLEAEVKKIELKDLKFIYDVEKKLFEAKPASEITIDMQSNFYVLHRYIFNVPVFVNAYPTFSSFSGVPVKNGFIDELWPWEELSNETLELTGFYQGYSGEFYDVIGEFSFFLKAYGFRKSLSQ